MTEVYVVTTGHYSDYGIRAIFSTRKRAELYAEYLKGVDQWSEVNDIETYVLDEVSDPLERGLSYYFVRMERNGDVGAVEEQVPDPSNEAFRVIAYRANSSFAMAHMWASSPEHAVKIANERRTQAIASGEWPAPGEEKA